MKCNTNCCGEGYALATFACSLVSCLSREEGELLAAQMQAVSDIMFACYAKEDCCKAIAEDEGITGLD